MAIQSFCNFLALALVAVATARVRWDEEGFEKKLGLGTVLAGTYFVV